MLESDIKNKILLKRIIIKDVENMCGSFESKESYFEG